MRIMKTTDWHEYVGIGVYVEKDKLDEFKDIVKEFTGLHFWPLYDTYKWDKWEYAANCSKFDYISNVTVNREILELAEHGYTVVVCDLTNRKIHFAKKESE